MMINDCQDNLGAETSNVQVVLGVNVIVELIRQTRELGKGVRVSKSPVSECHNLTAHGGTFRPALAEMPGGSMDM